MRRVINIAMVIFGLNMAITGIWNLLYIFRDHGMTFNYLIILVLFFSSVRVHFITN